MIRSLLFLLAGVGPAPGPRPRLIVVITVDQLRPDYLERYHSQLLGGFATLLKGGASFSDAYQDHAITETAPTESRSEEHTSELQSQSNLVCRLLLEKKKTESSLSLITCWCVSAHYDTL